MTASGLPTVSGLISHSRLEFPRFRGRFRGELLNGEIFYSLKESQIVIEQWRRHYNTKRPHNSLGYQPPTPEAIIPLQQRPPMNQHSNRTNQVGLATGLAQMRPNFLEPHGRSLQGNICSSFCLSLLYPTQELEPSTNKGRLNISVKATHL